jgi:hypothetical protein
MPSRCGVFLQGQFYLTYLFVCTVFQLRYISATVHLRTLSLLVGLYTCILYSFGYDRFFLLEVLLKLVMTVESYNRHEQ